MHWRMVGGLYGILRIYWKTYLGFSKCSLFNRDNVYLSSPSAPSIFFELFSVFLFERGFAFLDGTDEAGWKLLALPLLGGALAVIVTNTLSCYEVRRNWSGGMWYTLSPQVSNTLPSMFVAQFWTQVNTLFPPHAQQATHSSRGEGWQCGSCSSSHNSNSIRCVKVCCSAKHVNVCNSWSCKRCYCVRYCNATGLHKSTMHAMREGTSRDCLPFPFPSPCPCRYGPRVQGTPAACHVAS